ncbi:MAG: hypothetical protein EA383_02175, partial [Spirochaetaceae bacterium]
VAGYYDQLISFLDHAVSEKFIKDTHRQLIMCRTSPDEIINLMENYRPPSEDKWFRPSASTAGSGGYLCKE